MSIYYPNPGVYCREQYILNGCNTGQHRMKFVLGCALIVASDVRPKEESKREVRITFTALFLEVLAYVFSTYMVVSNVTLWNDVHGPRAAQHIHGPISWLVAVTMHGNNISQLTFMHSFYRDSYRLFAQSDVEQACSIWGAMNWFPQFETVNEGDKFYSRNLRAQYIPLYAGHSQLASREMTNPYVLGIMVLT